MKIKIRNVAELAISMTVIGALLAACGGGGGGSSAAASGSLSGTAAVGTAIVGGNVKVVCKSGTQMTTTTDSSGKFSVSLANETLPCALGLTTGTINGAVNTVSYMAIATVPGTVNLTPLTDLVVANLIQDPVTSHLFTATGATAIGAITQAQVDTALAHVATMLPGLPALTTINNPLTTAFTPTSGNAIDDSLTAFASATSAVAASSVLANAATSAPVAVSGVVAAYANTVSGGAYSVPETTALAGTSGTPITTYYSDFLWTQDVNGTPVSTTSSIVDNGLNSANPLTFGLNGLSSATLITDSSGNYAWGGANINGGNGIFNNSQDVNVPALAEICQTISTNKKSTDVLVASTATPVLTAAGLAGLTFNTYIEDCGASGAGSTLTFAADGSLTFFQPGNTSSNTLTASQVTAALTGTAQTFLSSGQSAFWIMNAYKIAHDSTTSYAIVIHLAPLASGNSGHGVISVFTNGSGSNVSTPAIVLADLVTTNLSSIGFPWNAQSPNFTGVDKRWDITTPIPVKTNGEARAGVAMDAIEAKLGKVIFDRTSIEGSAVSSITRGIIFSQGTAYLPSGGNPQNYCANVSNAPYSGGYPNNILVPASSGVISTVLYVNLDNPQCTATADIVIHEIGHALGFGAHFNGFGLGPSISTDFWSALATLYSNPIGTPTANMVILMK